MGPACTSKTVQETYPDVIITLVTAIPDNTRNKTFGKKKISKCIGECVNGSCLILIPNPSKSAQKWLKTISGNSKNGAEMAKMYKSGTNMAQTSRGPGLI